MNVEMWPVDKPIPYARNARKLSPKAIDKVAASIREFGFRQPIVVDKAGTIICGHTRLQGAQKLGLVEDVPEEWLYDRVLNRENRAIIPYRKAVDTTVFRFVGEPESGIFPRIVIEGRDEKLDDFVFRT